MKHSNFVFLYFVFLSISLNGQVLNSQDLEKSTSIQRKSIFILDELKVRWKKAALENCPGVPCITNTVPGAPSGVVATVGAASASVAFVAPASNGGSVITGYTVTSSPGGITATGASLSINVTGLTNGTAYTFTVVATNAVGNSVASAASTAVTPVAAFVCGVSTIADLDNNLYNTVLIIGTTTTQCWTTTNLKVTKYNDGTLISDLTASTSNPWAPTSGALTGYVASGVTGYVGTFGYLYNWYAVNDSRKLCPSGWHVPTDSEWTNLIQIYNPTASASVDGTQSTSAGTVLKSNVTNSSGGSGLGWDPGSVGTNTSGFSALPGGYRDIDGSFYDVRTLCSSWTATSFDTLEAWYRDMFNNNGNVTRGKYDKLAGLSVRCLRD